MFAGCWLEALLRSLRPPTVLEAASSSGHVGISTCLLASSSQQGESLCQCMLARHTHTYTHSTIIMRVTCHHLCHSLLLESSHRSHPHSEGGDYTKVWTQEVGYLMFEFSPPISSTPPSRRKLRAGNCEVTFTLPTSSHMLDQEKWPLWDNGSWHLRNTWTPTLSTTVPRQSRNGQDVVLNLGKLIRRLEKCTSQVLFWLQEPWVKREEERIYQL